MRKLGYRGLNLPKVTWPLSGGSRIEPGSLTRGCFPTLRIFAILRAHNIYMSKRGRFMDQTPELYSLKNTSVNVLNYVISFPCDSKVRKSLDSLTNYKG